MILGIGNDLCDVERMAGVIQRHGRRFLDRTFTQAEQASPSAGRNRTCSMRVAFAAEGGIREGARHRYHRAGTLDGHVRFLPLDRVNQSRQFRAERSTRLRRLADRLSDTVVPSRSRTMLDLLLRLLFSKHAIDEVGAQLRNHCGHR